MQLQGKADAATEYGRRHTGDVAVHRLAGRRAEEPDAGADKLTAVEGASDIVARLGQRPQQLGSHRGVLRVGPPDPVVQAIDRFELGQFLNLPDPDAR